MMMESQRSLPKQYSFEFFPPKTPEGIEKLRATRRQLEQLQLQRAPLLGVGMLVRSPGGQLGPLRLRQRGSRLCGGVHFPHRFRTRSDGVQQRLREQQVRIASEGLLRGGARKGGMPLYKFVSNRFLTTVENLVLGAHFSELHTGYRAYSRRFLETVPFLRNSNDFVFDTEVVAQAVTFGLKVTEVPVETRYFAEASSASFRQSLVYGLKTLWVMAKLLANRLRIRKSPLFRQ